ncbi:uncharacterized protein TM35_000811060, partial [Trypanosoma theileri]
TACSTPAAAALCTGLHGRVLSTVVRSLPESVGNHLFTANNNIFATVFSTRSTEKINPDDTHWARVHQFVWKYLISFLFFILVSRALMCTLWCVSLCNCVVLVNDISFLFFICFHIISERDNI